MEANQPILRRDLYNALIANAERRSYGPHVNLALRRPPRWTHCGSGLEACTNFTPWP